MIAPWTATAAVAAGTASIVPRRTGRASGRRNIGHFRQTRHARGVNHHVTARTAARAFAAQCRLSA